jgi:hypothetical protein
MRFYMSILTRFRSFAAIAVFLLLLGVVSAIPFPRPRGAKAQVVDVRRSSPLHSRSLSRRNNGTTCVKLTAKDLKSLPGYSKLTQKADAQWGTGKRKIVVNDSKYPDQSAFVCIKPGSATLHLDESQPCTTTNDTIGGGMKGTNGTISLAEAEGFTATGQLFVSGAATIGTSGTFSTNIDFPQVAGVNEAFTSTVSITNTVSESFTAQYSTLVTLTILMTNSDGKSCNATTEVNQCITTAQGKVELEAQGTVWFEYDSKTKEKNNTAAGEHYKWSLDLETELAEADRSSYISFKSENFRAETHAIYNGSCVSTG